MLSCFAGHRSDATSATLSHLAAVAVNAVLVLPMADEAGHIAAHCEKEHNSAQEEDVDQQPQNDGRTFSHDEIESVLQVLAAAKKTARNAAWQPVGEGAEGWSIRWQKRGGGAKIGDTYWQTPTGDEVRSGPDARRWMERGGAPDPDRGKRNHVGSTSRREDLSLENIISSRDPGTKRTSLLTTPIDAGNVELVESILERHGNASLQPGMLQRAVLQVPMLRVLLSHLPAGATDCPAQETSAVAQEEHAAERARRQRILDGLDERGHSALSLACLDRGPEGFAADATLVAAQLLLAAGASVDLPVRNGRSKALNEACAADNPRLPARTALIDLLLVSPTGSNRCPKPASQDVCCCCCCCCCCC